MKKSLFDFEEETTYKEVSIKETNWDLFKQYYKLMMYSGDCDPSYPSLNYICDRLELTQSQRYWISFLYGVTYSAPSTLYIYNEFPDMENVDIGRLKRWYNANRSKVIFREDRKRALLRSKNDADVDKFIACVESYIKLVGKDQEKTFSQFMKIQPLEKRYQEVYKFLNNIYTFGRFTLFNYVEALNEITDLKTAPDVLQLREAESSRNGLCYACSLESQVTLHHHKSEEPVNFDLLQNNLVKLKEELQKENPEINVNFWNIETCLCSFKKLFWNDRYFGYYIDRQMIEILEMENNVPSGVDWSILWNFRKEYFDNKLLGELNWWKGIRKERMSLFNKTNMFINKNENIDVVTRQYMRKKKFEIIGEIYENIRRV